MLPLARPARRAVMGAIGAGALAGAMLFGAAATARPSRHLQPQFHRRARPPNCRASCQASRSTRRTTYPPTPT